MSTNHNRIKVADLEINEPNKILTTNTIGELEFSDINNIKTDSYNALDYSIAGKALDARQGKILKDLIDNINALLASDNVNLDTVQKLVDAIETVQISLSTILVNDVTTGGTTKALTAEMGKNLKNQVDALTNALTDKINTTDLTQDIEANKISTSKITSVKQLFDWAVAKFVQITNIKTVNGNSLIGTGNIATPDMDTTTAQNVSGMKTFLAGMFGLRNTANTFTSFFTSAVTASRTWTWPDKSGTVAMTSDLPTNTIATGTQNFITKYNNVSGTQIGNSRLKDDGVYLGVGSVSPIALSKDIQLGRDANKEIGIEQSDSSTAGKDLIITAGRTINFKETTSFITLNQITRAYGGIATAPNGDVYITVFPGDIYKQTGGTGNFVALGQISRQWTDIAVDPNGDVYAVGLNIDIYKQTGGTGNFVALGLGSKPYAGITIAPNGDLYVSEGGGQLNGSYFGDIWKRTGRTGGLVAAGLTARNWGTMAAAPNGDIYVAGKTDILKQTGGVGNFIGLGQTNRGYYGVGCAPNGDIYAVTGSNGSSGDIYKQTGGTGNFIGLGQVSRAYTAIATDLNGNVYTGVYNGDIYYQNNISLGIADLDGGTLKLKAGTGKNLGKSRVQIITGQKSAVSGTDMQIETVRAEYYEDGNYKRIGTPVYADNTAAIAGGLTAGMEYRTNTGVKMEVY